MAQKNISFYLLYSLGTFNIEVRHLDVYQSSERGSHAAIGSSKIFSVVS